MTPLLRRTGAAALAVAVLAAPFVAPATADAAHKAKRYSNCKALNKDYPHGVGRKGAKDHHTAGSKAVRNFTVSTKVYNLNRGRDRDHDGIACEKH